ncbi:unnamed protein product [Acanthoscelides obtectus]|uniref:Uncharacterized protein n=1 Tax=Acanthoscelides obtectus TaxID=200917 RepID=A0A9P0PZ44_ACAOB|nr:unnamed protein product [Acanthoscelides obtectus]CAK1634522.1 hypothetical protein AOBTE_LOCUS8789 [Acanthoscelides obtectus]
MLKFIIVLVPTFLSGKRFFPVRLFLLLFIFDTLIRKTLNNNNTTITTQQ